MATSSSALISMSTPMACAPLPPRAPQLLQKIRVSKEVVHGKSMWSSRRRCSPGMKQMSFTSIRSEDTTTSDIVKLQKQVASLVLWEPSKILQPEAVQSPSKVHRNETPDTAAVEEPLLHPFDDIQVGQRWREIQGSRNWDGLLDPIDPVLRSEMIRYGEFAQSAYDAFDNGIHSKYCGSCKYSRRHLLERVKLENRGYEVTHYLHSTATERLLKMYHRPLVVDDEKWSKDSNWIGYVAVSTSPREIARLGRRDILVVWRGTVTESEWMEHYQNAFIPKGLDPHGGDPHKSIRSKLRVEDTFLEMYQTKNVKSRYNKTSAQEQVTAAVKELLEKYGDEEISITVIGHSMGGALATLCAYDLAASGTNRRRTFAQMVTNLNSDSPGGDGHGHGDLHTVPITVYSFGPPRVGNNAFRDRVMELGVKVLRVVNVNDLVPYVPGVIFNEKLEFLHPRNFAHSDNKWIQLLHNFLEWLPITYAHVGADMELDDKDSPFLKKGPLDKMNVHNLELYLHLLDGFVAKGVPFTPSGRRDKALVNKSSSFLDSSYGIPEFWWQEKNKGLVRNSEGRWVSPERDPEDIPRQVSP